MRNLVSHVGQGKEFSLFPTFVFSLSCPGCRLSSALGVLGVWGSLSRVFWISAALRIRGPDCHVSLVLGVLDVVCLGCCVIWLSCVLDVVFLGCLVSWVCVFWVSNVLVVVCLWCWVSWM